MPGPGAGSRAGAPLAAAFPKLLLAALAGLLLSASAEPAPPAITDTGIGKLQLGKPIPRALLGKQPEKQYEASYYADAQPLEGFRLVEPPVFAAVAGGPFRAFGNKNPGEPAPPRLRAQAAARARAGKLKVEMLVVTSARLKTAAGIGVGSRWQELRKAHPTASLRRLPALWEEPTCVAQMGGIWFFFTGCSGAPTGKVELPGAAPVTRVVIRAPTD